METAKAIGPSILVIAIGLLPWFLDKRGVAVPPWLITGGGCVVILAFFYGLLNPMAWLLDHVPATSGPNVSRSVFLSTVILSVVGAVALSWWLVASVKTERREETIMKPHATHLRLQFNVGNAIPFAIEQGNIWRWYALANIFQPIDPSGKKKLEGIRVWTLFLVFDKPIAVKQFRIDGGGATLPIYEVKDSSQRHAVISFNGDLTSLVLHVQALN